MSRGSNPKSQQNLLAGKNKRPDAVRTTVRLNPETIELAKKIGNGEITKGIDAMAKILIQFTEADLNSFLEGYGGNIDELIADVEQNPEAYEDDINGASYRRISTQKNEIVPPVNQKVRWSA
jgi:hypothetical protein